MSNNLSPLDEIIVNTQSSLPPASAESSGLSPAEMEQQLKILRMEAELADLKKKAVARQVNAYDDGEDSHGKSYPEIVLSIARQIPGISYKDVDDILNNKFKTSRFAYLRRRVHDPEDDQTMATVTTSGALAYQTKSYNTKQFGNDLFTWSECALNYLQIYIQLFGKEHRATSVAFTAFICFVMKKGRTYTSTACIHYALATFDINGPTKHDPACWVSPSPDWQAEYFYEGVTKKRMADFRSPMPPAQRPRWTTSSSYTTPGPGGSNTGSDPGSNPGTAKYLNDRPWASPNWDKEVCYGYNTYKNGCKWGSSCKLKHQCHKCKGDHPQNTCPN